MKKESNKNFNLLLTASTFSNLADGIAGFAYPWLFSLLTRDPLLISIVSVLVNLPRLIFVLYAGVIADKFNRQKILIFTRLGQVFLTSIFIVLIYLNLDNIADKETITRLYESETLQDYFFDMLGLDAGFWEVLDSECFYPVYVKGKF